MKILFSGGGTLGPVTPLLALHENIQTLEDLQYVWVGTKNGPEEVLVQKAGIRFLSLPSSKLRRYFSLQTVLDAFIFVQAFVQAVFLLRREKPDVCISAGGYVSVPLHFAARFLCIPTWIHQQDVVLGLANRLMAPAATLITVALPQSIVHFPKDKTRLLGNPVRASILSGNKAEALKQFNLEQNLPVIFATGGGTGSEKINVLIAQVALELDSVAQIIHLTGKERKILEPAVPLRHYHTFEFLDEEMKNAYAVADIVVSRGGFGTLSEMAALKKAAIVIPKPGHQEENIQFCAKQGGLLYLDENVLTVHELTQKIRELLGDTSLREQLGHQLSSLIPQASTGQIRACLTIFRK